VSFEPASERSPRSVERSGIQGLRGYRIGRGRGTRGDPSEWPPVVAGRLDRILGRAYERRRMRVAAWAMVGLMSALACRGARGPIQDVDTDDGVRDQPLSIDEAANILGGRAGELSRCYTFERLNMNLPDGADYVAQVFVPNDGTDPVVELVDAAVPGLETLESCLVRTLQRTRFPAHAGPPITLNVPIRAPR